MECQFCEVAHVLGPYVLVILFAIVFSRTIKRFHEQIVQLHGRTVDAFERQASSYERVHFDIIKTRKDDAKEFASKDVSEGEAHTKKR
jgi:hypothetical protein